MAQQVILPKQGQSVETCLIIAWKKHEGDAVQEGEVLVEVETDKAAFEVPSTASGTILKILHQEGEDVPVLAPLAIVGRPGEDISALAGEAAEAGQAGAAQAVSAGAAAPEAGAAVRAGPAPETPAAEGKVRISPRARRLASGSGLSPEQVAAALSQGEGSGPRGRILEQDVRGVLAAAAPRSASGAAPQPAAGYPGPVQELPVKGVRKVIAERMLASIQSTAHYSLHCWARADSLLAFRRRFKESSPELGLTEITVSDLLSYAAARVLLRHPGLNAHFRGDTIRQYERVHLGFAVDTPRGLLVPVIRNASLLSLRQLAAEAARLQEACLEGKVTPDELGGGTFTVSNLGPFGIESFTPVLNPPEVGILGVGSIHLRPVQEGGEIAFRSFISLSLTVNHQAVDGAPGARFLRDLSQALEALELLLAS
jgi:pyruvate dehydrogenase E2 component (dihydrolipoamide acetyltransferase)